MRWGGSAQKIHPNYTEAVWMKPVFSVIICAAFALFPLNLYATQAVRVQVITPRAPVMSSTTPNAYVACRLNTGASVDIYHQTADGWLAIRPPADCFSLVNANDMQLSETNSSGQIRSLEAKSWIGGYESLVVNYESVITLKQNERVHVLATRRMRVTPDAPLQTYIKILPPNGEFRWIHKRHVNLTTNQKPIAQVNPNAENIRPDVSNYQTVHSEIQPASYTTDMYGAPRQSFVPRWVKPSGGQGLTSSRDSVRSAGDIQPAAASFEIPKKSGADATCHSLNKALSATVSHPPDQWHLSPIRDGLMTLLQQDLTETQRAKAQSILDRVQKFQDLQRSRTQLNVAQALTNSYVRPASHMTELDVAASGFDRPIGTGVLNSEAAATNYDSKGWLVNVRSSRTDAPPYALVDNDGNVIVFISPAPGLNLSHYIHKNVGIFGRRGYLHRLRTPHISVNRIVDLARHME